MFDNLFTTYLAEPPSIVSDEIKSVEQKYNQFIQTGTIPNYEGLPNMLTDNLALLPYDPLLGGAEAPSITSDVSDDILLDVSKNTALSRKPIPPKPSNKSTGSFSNKLDFVRSLNSTYQQVLAEHNLDPNYSYILTSAAVLESAWGKKVSGNYNYGGVKGKYGTVKSTIDYVDGKYVRRNLTFRNFDSMKDYCNYVVNLLSNKRYNAFNTYSSSNPLAFWRHVLDAGYGGGDKAGKDRYMSSVRSIHNTVMQWT